MMEFSGKRLTAAQKLLHMRQPSLNFAVEFYRDFSTTQDSSNFHPSKSKLNQKPLLSPTDVMSHNSTTRLFANKRRSLSRKSPLQAHIAILDT
jgi:hypothetical protein